MTASDRRGLLVTVTGFLVIVAAMLVTFVLTDGSHRQTSIILGASMLVVGLTTPFAIWRIRRELAKAN